MAITSERIKLTKPVADNATPAIVNGKVRQKLYLDTTLRGFGLCVGSQSKTFFAQRELRGKTIRYTIGRYGVFTVDQARQEARQKLAQMARGENPVEEERKKRAQGLTLEEAWKLEADTLRSKGRSQKTLARYEHTVHLYLKGWLKKNLVSITREDVRLKHKQIAEDVAAGKYARGRIRTNSPGFNTANDVMRVLRAIWNRARRQHPELPESPTVNVDWFNMVAPRSALTAETLNIWYQAVKSSKNTVRRDALLLMLFSGLRRTNASEIRWTDVDFERKALFIPKPKSGRAFYLPLSNYLLELLQNRQQENAEFAPSSPWVFPAESASGHLEEPRLEVPGVDWSPHDLRRTFVTVAEGLDISYYALKSLVNHSQPNNDVTAGYISMDVERLRAPMQAITDKLLTICEGPKTPRVVPIRLGKEA
jgi:integrase